MATAVDKLDVKIGDLVDIDGRRYDVVSDNAGAVALEPAITVSAAELHTRHGGRPTGLGPAATPQGRGCARFTRWVERTTQGRGGRARSRRARPHGSRRERERRGLERDGIALMLLLPLGVAGQWGRRARKR